MNAKLHTFQVHHWYQWNGIDHRANPLMMRNIIGPARDFCWQTSPFADGKEHICTKVEPNEYGDLVCTFDKDEKKMVFPRGLRWSAFFTDVSVIHLKELEKFMESL